MRTEEQVRRALARRLGRPPREDVWAHLVDELRIEEVLEGEYSIEDLLGDYQDTARHFPAGGAAREKKEHPPRTVPPDERLWALSRILAAHTAQGRAVVAFRREVLKDRLLSLAEVSAWVQEKAAEEQALAVVQLQMTILLPPEGLGAPQSVPSTPRHRINAWLDFLAKLTWEERQHFLLSFGIRTELLDYRSPEGEPSLPETVSPNGTLGRLKRIARRLNWWLERDAVSWVLTGEVPPIHKATVRIVWSGGAGPDRVILTLDPRLSKQEVAELYAQERRRVFTGRDKPMTEKHLALAVFAAEHAGPWTELMAKWNRERPQWPYANRFLFSRDARAAYRRVTGHPRQTDAREPAGSRLPEEDAPHAEAPRA